MNISQFVGSVGELLGGVLPGLKSNKEHNVWVHLDFEKFKCAGLWWL